MYIPALSWLGIDRAMKLVGLNAFVEGARTGRPLAHSFDKAFEDAVEGWAHPALGPVLQVVYTLATGKNTIGMSVAARAKGPGQSQKVENLKAAAANLNPAVGAATGYNRPQHGPPPTALERAASVLRPVVGQRKTPPGKDTGLIRR